jgi:hypothetical protein
VVMMGAEERKRDQSREDAPACAEGTRSCTYPSCLTRHTEPTSEERKDHDCRPFVLQTRGGVHTTHGVRQSVHSGPAPYHYVNSSASSSSVRGHRCQYDRRPWIQVQVGVTGAAMQHVIRMTQTPSPDIAACRSRRHFSKRHGTATNDLDSCWTNISGHAKVLRVFIYLRVRGRNAL